MAILPVGALAQRLHEFARGQRLDIAFALQRLFVGVHRIGDVDRDHQFNVDWNGAWALVGQAGGGSGKGAAATAAIIPAMAK